MRIRRLHLSTQVLAIVGIVVLCSAGRRELSAIGMPAEEYTVEFNGRLADLQREGMVSGAGPYVRFLRENVPGRLELGRTFIRLLLLLGVVIILPVGVGAWIHGRLSRRRPGPCEEGFAMLARVGWVLGVLAAAGTASSAAYAHARLDAAGGELAGLGERLARAAGEEAEAAVLIEAYKTVRSSARALRVCAAVTLTILAMTLVLGVALSVMGVRQLLRGGP